MDKSRNPVIQGIINILSSEPVIIVFCLEYKLMQRSHFYLQVGMKGSPDNLNRGLDCDVIVAEVRATSHKPDEIYGIIERLSPGTRKIELFGRPHNVQPNW
jgi:N6-adenosine-specific RNA methylase IME4